MNGYTPMIALGENNLIISPSEGGIPLMRPIP